MEKRSKEQIAFDAIRDEVAINAIQEEFGRIEKEAAELEKEANVMGASKKYLGGVFKDVKAVPRAVKTIVQGPRNADKWVRGSAEYHRRVKPLKRTGVRALGLAGVGAGSYGVSKAVPGVKTAGIEKEAGRLNLVQKIIADVRGTPKAFNLWRNAPKTAKGWKSGMLPVRGSAAYAKGVGPLKRTALRGGGALGTGGLTYGATRGRGE